MKKKHYETPFKTLVKLRRLHCYPIILDKIVDPPQLGPTYYKGCRLRCGDKRCQILVSLLRNDYTEALKLVSNIVTNIAKDCQIELVDNAKHPGTMSVGNWEWIIEVLGVNYTLKDCRSNLYNIHKLECIEFCLNRYKPEISEVLKFFISNGNVLHSEFPNKEHYVKKAQQFKNRIDLLYMLKEQYGIEFINLLSEATRFQRLLKHFMLYLIYAEDTTALIKIVELFDAKDEALMLSVEDLSGKSLEALLDHFEYDKSEILEYNKNNLQGIIINKIARYGNKKALDIIAKKFNMYSNFVRDVLFSSGNLDLMMDLSTPEEPMGYECSSFASAALF